MKLRLMGIAAMFAMCRFNGPVPFELIAANNKIQQIDDAALLAELEEMRAEGLVTFQGGLWELTPAGRERCS